jgi:Ca2+-binding RTX toxin-like protein
MRLQVEQLEARDLAAVSVFQQGDALTVLGTPRADAAQFNPVPGDPTGVAADLDYDGTTDRTFTGVRTINALLGSGDDVAAFQPGVTQLIRAFGGRGDDVLTAFTGGSILSGDDGDDLIYQIVAPGVISGGKGRDWIVTNAAVTFDLDPRDRDPVVFGIVDGSQPVQIAGNVAFVAGTPGDDVIFVRGRTVTVNGVPFALPRNVTTVASLTGNGNDVVDAADADVSIVVYTGNGDDAVSGSAQPDVIKGGGGNDVVLGGGGDDFLSGSNGQPDPAGFDVVSGGPGKDVIQANATTFVLYAGQLDLVLGVPGRRRGSGVR